MSVPVPVALLISSLLAVLFARLLFRRQPASRRLFLIGLGPAMILTPALLALLDLKLRIGVFNLELPADLMSGSEWFWWLLCASGVVPAGVLIVRAVVERTALDRLPLLDDGRIDSAQQELSAALHLDGPVIFRQCHAACSTTLGGRLILLPPSWRNWSSQTLRAVIAHELVHVTRRDDLWCLVNRMLTAFFWWLPWLRTLPVLMERAVEESCDDLAAHLVCGDERYLEGVYDVAREQLPAFDPAVGISGGAMADRFRRFTAFRDQQVDSRGLYWASLGLIALQSLLWSVHVVPAAESLPERTRIVATATEDAADGYRIRLTELATRPGADAVRVDPQLRPSEHDPPGRQVPRTSD